MTCKHTERLVSHVECTWCLLDAHEERIRALEEMAARHNHGAHKLDHASIVEAARGACSESAPEARPAEGAGEPVGDRVFWRIGLEETGGTPTSSPIKPSPSGADERIRPEIRALIARGNVTLEEWKELRCNSYEFQALYPHLNDRALVHVIRHTLKNCFARQSGGIYQTYNDALAGLLVPILLERFESCGRVINRYADAYYANAHEKESKRTLTRDEVAQAAADAPPKDGYYESLTALLNAKLREKGR